CRALFVRFFFSSRRRHTRFSRDWSSDVCSSDLTTWEVKKHLWKPRLGLHGIAQISWLRDVLIFHGAGVGGGSLVYAATLLVPPRSEERRVGKEGGSRWWPAHGAKKVGRRGGV